MYPSTRTTDISTKCNSLRASDDVKIAMLSPSSDDWCPYKIRTFKGDGSIPIQVWIRNFEDWLATKGTISDEVKISLLKCYTDGIPRDILSEVDSETSYEAVKKFLLKSYESPKSRDLSRQILRSTTHLQNETVDQFAFRLAPLVRAAYSDENEKVIMRRTLEEFVDKLREPFGLLMSGQVYNTFEEARLIAKSVEAAILKSKGGASTSFFNCNNL